MKMMHVYSYSRSLLLMMVFLFFFSCTQSVTIHHSNNLASKSTDSIRVGIAAYAPPLVYKTGGKLQGLEIDFAGQLGTYLGKEIRFVEIDWDNLLPALEEGRIDVIMSGMTITPKRSYRVSFAEPYMRSGQILLVRSDQARKYSSGIYSLMGNRPPMGVIENTIGDFFITKNINRPNLQRYQSSKAAVDALIEEKIDVFVHDAPIICYFAAMQEKNRVTPILQMATEEYLAWAVNKTDTDLLKKLNEFIDMQKGNNELQATIKRWIPYM